MKKETSNSFLEYSNQILFVRIKEGAEMTIESMREQYNAQLELVKNNKYAVLVDGTSNVDVPSETRVFMANHSPSNRKATAIVTNKNLATRLIANFYLKVNKPKVLTKLFKTESDAIRWLKNELDKTEYPQQ